MAEETTSPQNLDIPTYQQHRENQIEHTLVDVRETWEYARGRIPGAVNIPLDELAERMDEIPPEKPVVVVCEHGIRSIAAAQFLAQAGYSGVYNLMGGTAEWMERLLPLDTSA